MYQHTATNYGAPFTLLRPRITHGTETGYHHGATARGHSQSSVHNVAHEDEHLSSGRPYNDRWRGPCVRAEAVIWIVLRSTSCTVDDGPEPGASAAILRLVREVEEHRYCLLVLMRLEGAI